MDRIDARRFLEERVGEIVYTLTQRRPNRILEVRGDEVLVGTGKSPTGRRVPIAWVQEALDLLVENGEVPIRYDVTGYRGAFIGAVLASVSGAEVLTGPRRVRLPATR